MRCETRGIVAPSNELALECADLSPLSRLTTGRQARARSALGENGGFGGCDGANSPEQSGDESPHSKIPLSSSGMSFSASKCRPVSILGRPRVQRIAQSVAEK